MYPNELLWDFRDPSPFASAFTENPLHGSLQIIHALLALIAVVWLLFEGSKSKKHRFVLAALVAVTVVFGFWWLYQSKHFRITREMAYELATHSYGVAKDNLTYVSELNENGGAKQTLLYTVRAVSHRAEKIEEIYQVFQPGLIADPVIVNETVRFRSRPEEGARKMTAKVQSASPHQTRVLHTIHPPIPMDSSAELLDPIRQDWPDGTYAMTKAKQTMPNEWASARVSYPANRLAMEVIFPLGLEPVNNSWGIDVWYGPAQAEHEAEKKRLTRAAGDAQVGYELLRHWIDEKDSRHHLRLEVQYPIHSLVYVITWLPNDLRIDERTP